MCDHRRRRFLINQITYKVFQHTGDDFYKPEEYYDSEASEEDTDDKALTPNQHFMIEAIRKNDTTPILGRRLFWSAADYAFLEGPTDLWTSPRIMAVDKTLLHLGFVKTRNKILEVQESRVKKLKIRIPNFVIVLYQKDLDILRQLMEQDKPMKDSEDLNALLNDGFISRRFTGYYYLSKWQRERTKWIIDGQASYAVEIHPDPKPPPPPRTYRKYRTDEERLEARRRQTRDAVRKLRACKQ